MRWVHRGKLGDWTEARTENELRKREDRRIDAFQHASVEALLEAEAHMPGSMGGVFREAPKIKRRRGRGNFSKRRKLRKDAYSSENDLLSDDMDQEEQKSLSAATLAPSLLLPVLNAHDLLRSKLLKQIFCNTHINSLSRTALDLRESEHNMKHALGRCFGAMERIFDSDPREREKNAVGSLALQGSDASGRREHIEESDDFDKMDTSEAGVENSQEKPDTEREADSFKNEDAEKQQDAEGSSSKTSNRPNPEPSPLGPMDIAPPLAQINNLFLTKGGLVVPVPENTAETTGPHSVTVTEEEQRDIVYASLSCLNDLYMDSMEYMERLDEVRSLLADIEWHRGHIWNMLRCWATKRDNEEYQATRIYNNAQSSLQDAHNADGMARNYDPDPGNFKTGSTASTNTAARGEYASSSSRSRAKRRSGK